MYEINKLQRYIVQQRRKKPQSLKLSDDKFRGLSLVLSSTVKTIQVNVNLCSTVTFHQTVRLELRSFKSQMV